MRSPNKRCPGEKGHRQEIGFLLLSRRAGIWVLPVSRRTALSITFSLTGQQHKAIRAVAQMNVIHTHCCSELQSNVPLCHL